MSAGFVGKNYVVVGRRAMRETTAEKEVEEPLWMAGISMNCRLGTTIADLEKKKKTMQIPVRTYTAFRYKMWHRYQWEVFRERAGDGHHAEQFEVPFP